MAVDEAPLAPITEGSTVTVEDARVKGSLMIEDDAMTSPDGEETDDTSLPMAASDNGTLDDEDSDDADNDTNNSSSIDNDNCQDDLCPKWSDALCTPSNAAVFTPAADINSLKHNMHGWGKNISISIINFNFICLKILTTLLPPLLYNHIQH